MHAGCTELAAYGRKGDEPHDVACLRGDLPLRFRSVARHRTDRRDTHFESGACRRVETSIRPDERIPEGKANGLSFARSGNRERRLNRSRRRAGQPGSENLKEVRRT